MTRALRRGARRNAAGILLTLLLLVLGLPAPAGELSEVPAVSPPWLNLRDLSAQPRQLDEFVGKVVLVNFWASWCRPCVDEMPALQRLAEAMQDKPFAIIGVNVGEGQRRVQAAARRLGIDFPVVLDKDNTVFRRWGATVLPTTYVLDRHGRIRFIGRGPLEWDRLDIVEMLGELADPPPPG